MVNRLFLLITIFLFVSCKTGLEELSMSKTPYNGNELRIDGYYYSNPDNYDGHIGVAVFYKDGFCFHIWGKPTNQDTLSYIENEILLNDAFIAKLKRGPDQIGAFRIIYPNIEIENWESRTAPVSYFGNVVSDTTFFINKRRNNNTPL